MIAITGATSGIGKSCAEVFASQGSHLLLLARRAERLEALKSELEAKHGIKVFWAQLDVSDKEAVSKWARENAEILAQVTVLVNNAGLAKGLSTIQEGNPDDWDVMWDTNVKGLLYITHAILPYFVKKKSGHVVNIGSVASRWAYAKGNIYSATKRAVSALTESMRLDLAGTNVRVTEIAPGMVETEFSVVRLGDAERAKAVYKGMDALTAQDIAEAVVWCTSRPQRVNIQEMVIYPTDQASTSNVVRRSE